MLAIVLIFRVSSGDILPHPITAECHVFRSVVGTKKGTVWRTDKCTAALFLLSIYANGPVSALIAGLTTRRIKLHSRCGPPGWFGKSKSPSHRLRFGKATHAFRGGGQELSLAALRCARKYDFVFSAYAGDVLEHRADDVHPVVNVDEIHQRHD